MFQLFFGTQPQKFLKKCDETLYARLMKKLDELRNDPFPTDVKRVIGKKSKAFRVRVGDHRIQYLVFHEKNEILVFDIEKRPKAY